MPKAFYKLTEAEQELALGIFTDAQNPFYAEIVDHFVTVHWALLKLPKFDANKNAELKKLLKIAKMEHVLNPSQIEGIFKNITRRIITNAITELVKLIKHGGGEKSIKETVSREFFQYIEDALYDSFTTFSPAPEKIEQILKVNIFTYANKKRIKPVFDEYTKKIETQIQGALTSLKLPDKQHQVINKLIAKQKNVILKNLQDAIYRNSAPAYFFTFVFLAFAVYTMGYGVIASALTVLCGWALGSYTQHQHSNKLISTYVNDQNPSPFQDAVANKNLNVRLKLIKTNDKTIVHPYVSGPPSVTEAFDNEKTTFSQLLSRLGMTKGEYKTLKSEQKQERKKSQKQPSGIGTNQKELPKGKWLDGELTADMPGIQPFYDNKGKFHGYFYLVTDNIPPELKGDFVAAAKEACSGNTEYYRWIQGGALRQRVKLGEVELKEECAFNRELHLGRRADKVVARVYCCPYQEKGQPLLILACYYDKDGLHQGKSKNASKKKPMSKDQEPIFVPLPTQPKQDAKTYGSKEEEEETTNTKTY